MKKKILFVIVTFQVLVILYLVFSLSQKKSNVLGETNINPINKKFIVASESGKLKFFYEPIPNTVEKGDEWKNLYHGNYKINADGLRENKEYSANKSQGNFRIMVLGDSFTFGELVSIENAWPKVLERGLNSLRCELTKEFEVINLGVRGYDIQYSAHRYLVRGYKYNPDLVIWLLKDDDFSTINDIMLRNSKQYEEEMRVSGELDKPPTEGDIHPLWARMLKEAGQVLQEMGEEKVRTLQISYLDEFRSNFTKDLVLLTLPVTNTNAKQLLHNYASSNEKTFYFEDVRDIYKLDGTFLPDDGHPNVKGHRIIAEDLLDYLTKDKLIPCNKIK